MSSQFFAQAAGCRGLPRGQLAAASLSVPLAAASAPAPVKFRHGGHGIQPIHISKRLTGNTESPQTTTTHAMMVATLFGATAGPNNRPKVSASPF